VSKQTVVISKQAASRSCSPLRLNRSKLDGDPTSTQIRICTAMQYRH
jgi:hypothetical protein